jgi:hypothetical protein
MYQNLKKEYSFNIFFISKVLFNRPCHIAEAFSKHFQSVYTGFCPGTFSSLNPCMEVLSFAPISNSDVQNAIKCLQPSKLVRLDGIPSFVIKGCSGIF